MTARFFMQQDGQVLAIRNGEALHVFADGKWGPGPVDLAELHEVGQRAFEHVASLLPGATPLPTARPEIPSTMGAARYWNRP